MEHKYRTLLEAELARRCSQNPRYSLRAFARLLGIEPAQLSRVLNQKQNISAPVAASIAEKLFQREKDRQYFVSLVDYSLAKKPQHRELALRKIEKFRDVAGEVNLQLDTLRAISDWYHIAILDMTALEDFRSEPKWISARLGVSQIEAKLATERLLKLGLLVREKGRLRKAERVLTTPTGVPSESIRRFHKQMIGKALDSVDEQSVEQRYLTAKTMSIAREDLPKLIELIEDFRRSTNELVGKSKRHDALYQLNIQLFDLQKGNRR